jgi:hypothetical protein
LSPKSAAFLALIGMILVAVLTIADLFQTTTGVLRGIAPAVAVFRSLIYAFASITLSVFLFVMYKRS